MAGQPISQGSDRKNSFVCLSHKAIKVYLLWLRCSATDVIWVAALKLRAVFRLPRVTTSDKPLPSEE